MSLNSRLSPKVPIVSCTGEWPLRALLSVILDGRNLPLKADILTTSAQAELDRKFQSPAGSGRDESHSTERESPDLPSQYPRRRSQRLNRLNYMDLSSKSHC